jgi:hypothetical protein
LKRGAIDGHDQYTTIVQSKPAQMVLTILNRGGYNANFLNDIR